MTYAWNARNQLASITGPSLSASFVYDSGRRIAKQINGSHWNFLFDGANLVQEQSVGYVTANLIPGFGVDETFARTDSSGSSFFLPDGINSTLALTNANGNVSAEYTYDPFGNTTQSGATTSTFQFTGHENDGTGLYYMRARYYSPALQRFISQDPIGFRGGINLYAYAGNNPVSSIDPLGTDPSGGGGNASCLPCSDYCHCSQWLWDQRVFSPPKRWRISGRQRKRQMRPRQSLLKLTQQKLHRLWRRKPPMQRPWTLQHLSAGAAIRCNSGIQTGRRSIRGVMSEVPSTLVTPLIRCKTAESLRLLCRTQ